MKKDTPVVLVKVKGGFIQEVFSSEEVRFVCVDYDVDGSELNRLTKVEGKDALVRDIELKPDEEGTIQSVLGHLNKQSR